MSEIGFEALAVLQDARCDGDVVKLPPDELDRSVYEEVNEVLTRLGGAWKRNKKGHVFPFDPAPLLKAVQETGEMPPKNPTAFFPTPKPIVDSLVDRIREWGLHDGCRVLEPSAGAGAICDGLAALAQEEGVDIQIDCVEILGLNRSRLEAKGYRLVGDDFTKFASEAPYDVVAMNPPFSVEGDKLAWLTHVKLAWGMVREGGCLAAIVSSAICHRSTKAIAEFRELAGQYGWWQEIEAGAFKESGTGVATALLWMVKLDQSWRSEPLNGYPSWHAWNVSLVNDANYDSSTAGDIAVAKGRDALRAHFEVIAEKCRETGDPVRLTESDHRFLFEHYREDRGMPVLKEVEGGVAEEGLGGLFEVAA